MLAVDTNIIVRYLTRDDEQQAARAKRLVDNSDVRVSLTVLLETEWVLRSVYRMTPIQIVDALTEFLGLPHVTVEDTLVAARALEWAAAGMDFADALHLAQAQHCDAFVSFDEALATAAADVPGVTVRAP
jgi:predicted nucleic acid-binding protein